MNMKKLVPGMRYKYQHNVTYAGRNAKAYRYIKCLQVTDTEATFLVSEDTGEVITLNSKEVASSIMDNR